MYANSRFRKIVSLVLTVAFISMTFSACTGNNVGVAKPKPDLSILKKLLINKVVIPEPGLTHNLAVKCFLQSYEPKAGVRLSREEFVAKAVAALNKALQEKEISALISAEDVVCVIDAFDRFAELGVDVFHPETIEPQGAIDILERNGYITQEAGQRYKVMIRGIAQSPGDLSADKVKLDLAAVLPGLTVEETAVADIGAASKAFWCGEIQDVLGDDANLQSWYDIIAKLGPYLCDFLGGCVGLLGGPLGILVGAFLASVAFECITLWGQGAFDHWHR